MSTMVLINEDGKVERKLALISPPADFQIPEGMTLSWRTVVELSSRDPLAMIERYANHSHPHEAYFYLGGAQGHVLVLSYEQSDHSDMQDVRYALRKLLITVQGTAAADVVALRDRLLEIVRSGSWQVSNDLDPKSRRGLFRRKTK